MKILPFIFALALASVSFAQNQRVTNLTFTNSIIAGSTTPGLITGTNGALTFTASGTNQNITLTPSGSTGKIVTGGSNIITNSSGANDLVIRGNLFVQIQTNNFADVPSAYFHTDGSVFIKKSTTSSNGDLQIASSSATTGLALGTRAAEVIYRPGINDTLRTNSTWNVAGAELQTNGNRVNYNLTVYAAGTAYAFTNADAAIDFGTTDPTVTINKAGTYIIHGRVYAKYNAATFVGNQTLTIKLRRTNNTAADVANSTHVATTRIITTITDSIGVMPLPPVIYTTTNTDDVISLFGSLSAVPSAGSVDATEASIIAVRLY